MVDRSRGQLLLVASVLVALVIVASAVLLNGVLTPETATTSSLSADATDLEGRMVSMQGDFERLFENATSVGEHDEALPYADHTDLQSDVEVFDQLVRNELANRSGSVVEIRYDDASSQSGNLVYNQTDGPFTNGLSNGWELATNVEPMPRARFNVTEQFEPDAVDATHIVVEDQSSSDTWAIAFASSDVYVDQSGSWTAVCGFTTPPTDPRIEVDARTPATQGARVTVHDADGDVLCSEPIDFGGSVDQPWRVRVENGNMAEGTYAISFDGNYGTGTLGPWAERESGVINPAFVVTYVSEGITYESEFLLFNEKR